MKCIYLHRGYFGLIKKYQGAREQIAVAGIKTLNSLQIFKIGQRFLLVRQFCRAFFDRNPIFFLFPSYFALSFSWRRLLHSVYTVPLAKSYKRDQRSHLGKTIDALIIGDNF